MDKKEILNWCREQNSKSGRLNIPEDMFAELTEELAKEIVSFFGTNILIRLPETEIEFFEWVKTKDPKVWNDLWDFPDEEPYIVSISFLPLLTDKLKGFPICDLNSEDNYYFTSQHIAGKEANMFLESVKERFMEKEKLALQQALILQISTQATDIWHFAYHFKTDIEKTKEAVKNLVAEKMLIHLTEAEHLPPFIDF